VYQQLNNGVWALNLRPILWSNGTLTLRHGVFNTPVMYTDVAADVIRWSNDNPA
jgi:hypothetical protein